MSAFTNIFAFPNFPQKPLLFHVYAELNEGIMVALAVILGWNIGLSVLWQK